MMESATKKFRSSPYQLFLSENEPDPGLWRLKSDPSTAPRAWIWVVGASNIRPFNKNNILVAVCRYLAESISTNEFGLLTGNKKGVDEEISSEFEKQFVGVGGKDINNFHRKYAPKASAKASEKNKKPQVIYLKDHHTTMESMAKLCDACIMVGGVKTALEAAKLCLSIGRPVFPIIEVGHNMELFYKEELLSMNEADRMALYGEAFNFEALRLNHQEAIHAIMKYLNLKFSTTDPPATGVWESFSTKFSAEIDELDRVRYALSDLDLFNMEGLASQVDDQVDRAIELLDDMYSEDDEITNSLSSIRSELTLVQEELTTKPNVRRTKDFLMHYQELATSAADIIEPFLRDLGY